MRIVFATVIFLLPVLYPLSTTAQSTLEWTFPLPRPHTGMLLGNGTQGLMVWGKERELIVTVGRAGFWDHRGGNDFSTRITYQELKELLMEEKEAAIQAAFAVPENEGSPNLGRPQQIGGGRLIITLPEGWELRRGELLMDKGALRVTAGNGSLEKVLLIQQAPGQELAWVTLPPGPFDVALRLVPSWEFVQDQLAAVGVAPPERWSNDAATRGGFVQTLPEDLPLAMAYRREGRSVTLATALREDGRRAVETLLDGVDLSRLSRDAEAWWQAYWAEVPNVVLPDPVLQEIYDYGLYKQACSTPPQGVACTLQGPFMESYQLPPWSNDYHFNINIEMIYYPALMSGRFEHLEPLWEMIDGWKEEITRNGETFFGREGALMLPHAVDDRCKVVGNFWTGTIDHACTAWMAQLAWLHYAYSGDREVLEETAWPLLVGAFEGYWAMLEERDGRFTLPVSVSPEYRGSRMDAWGRDASFQLAALHAVCNMLPQAARALGREVDERWEDVSRRLPPYTTIEGVYMQEWNLSNERIALWEGMDLIESHRHHSHLGSIWPFVTVDPDAEEHYQIVRGSLDNWRYRGAGGWSGWCVPWAAILLARTGETEAAVNWLHYWEENFTNQGRGTLHNANTSGHSLIGSPIWEKLPDDQPNREIMQLDAGFGALIAVYELLLQQRLDGLHVLPDMPVHWQTLAFDDIRAEGGFRISARVRNGRVQEVTVRATRAGELVLYPYLGDAWTMNGEQKRGAVLQRSMEAGEMLVLKRN